MTDNFNEIINVVITWDLSDEQLEAIRAVSPRLRVERHVPTVADKVWATADVLFTVSQFPTPEQAPRLRWIQLYSAGVDHLKDHPILQSNKVEVTSASGVHSTQMAEFSLGMILAFNLNLRHMIDMQARGEWQRMIGEGPAAKPVYMPRELRTQTLGIHGYGSVGRELARQANALGMRVLATKRDLMQLTDDGWYEPNTGDPTGDIPARLYPSEALASLARECDYLVVTAPLTAASHHCINGAVLEAMKPTAVLVNVSRGALVDEAALIQALVGHKIGGAALDVFEQEPLSPDSPLWKMNNVIISPHVSGLSTGYHNKMTALFSENLRRYLEHEPLLNLLDRQNGY